MKFNAVRNVCIKSLRTEQNLSPPFSKYVPLSSLLSGNENLFIVESKFLSDTKKYLASAVMDKPIKVIKYYTLRQLNLTLFPY